MRTTLKTVYYLSGVVNALFGINRRIKFEYWINVKDKVRIDTLKSLALISTTTSLSIFGLFYTAIGFLILLSINVLFFIFTYIWKWVLMKIKRRKNRP